MITNVFFLKKTSAFYWLMLWKIFNQKDTSPGYHGTPRILLSLLSLSSPPPGSRAGGKGPRAPVLSLRLPMPLTRAFANQPGQRLQHFPRLLEGGRCSSLWPSLQWPRMVGQGWWPPGLVPMAACRDGPLSQHCQHPACLLCAPLSTHQLLPKAQ